MDAQGWIISALCGAIAFMGRHYFLRIERHLKANHRVLNLIHQHDIRITLLEIKVFGKEMERLEPLVPDGEAG